MNLTIFYLIPILKSNFSNVLDDLNSPTQDLNAQEFLLCADYVIIGIDNI